MIVDDSTVARAILSRMIESDPIFEIAAVAGTAEDAIDALAHCQVDVVILDLEMPGLGGLKSIPRIIEAAAGARVLIVSSLAEDGAEATVAALALGAADTLPKPGVSRFNGKFAEILLGKVRALGLSRSGVVPPGPVDRSRAGGVLRAMPSDPIAVLAIGASTGGIHSLGKLFEALPKQIGVPILITQHLPAPFMPVFARQLSVIAKRPAQVAKDGLRLADDLIILAPGDAHLKVVRDRYGAYVQLEHNRSLSGCLPSVDPMFSSVAIAYGARALGVVLTGMGRDGVEGSARIVGCGGAVIAQDENSSAVWGMPRAVYEANLACALLPPEKIARRIAARVEGAPPCR